MNRGRGVKPEPSSWLLELLVVLLTVAVPQHKESQQSSQELCEKTNQINEEYKPIKSYYINILF